MKQRSTLNSARKGPQECYWKIIDTKHIKFNHQNPTSTLCVDDTSNCKQFTHPNVNQAPGSKTLDKIPENTPSNSSPIMKEESNVNSLGEPLESDSTVEENLRLDLRNQEDLLKPDCYGFISKKLPKFLAEAIKIPWWKESALKEFKTIKDQEFWEEVNEKIVTNPLNTVPVFKIKQNAHRKAPILKTWLCVQGFNQQYGLDYLETYAPTGKVVSLRAVLTYVAEMNLEMLQLDVKGSFLHP